MLGPYTYDEVGNRVEEIQYAPGGGQTVRSYSSPEEGQGPAHAITGVEEQGVGGVTEHSYDYDAAGNMVRRTTGERDQVLEWGPEGELVQVTEGVDRTEYVYDADGERLLRRANGATTLYLPGMEVTWDPAAGAEEATRYFEHAGETVAVREDDGSLHWVFSDHHGTGEMAVDAVWGEVAQRRMTVFGQNRGATGAWPGERGFVDGAVDESTGLTQLGARAYDAALGRFVSVDPLMKLADAQSMNGYAYANNSPATYWDGNGLAAWDIQQMKARENYLRNTGYYDSPAPENNSGNSSAVSITISITVYPGGGVRTNWKRMNYGPNVTTPYLMSTPSYNAPTNYWNGPVKSPKEEAIEDATWLSQAGDAVGGWFKDRYTKDSGGLNWETWLMIWRWWVVCYVQHVQWRRLPGVSGTVSGRLQMVTQRMVSGTLLVPLFQVLLVKSCLEAENT